MGDKHIGEKALETTGSVYLYRNKVTIPPLAMVDEIIGISEIIVELHQ